MPLFNLAGKYTNILQGVRDFALDRFVSKPEALFIKAMTGGAPTQTTMNKTELGQIKDAFQTQKLTPLKSPQELLEEANRQQADYVNSDKYFGETLTPPTLEDMQKKYDKAKAEQQSPVTNLYGHARDVNMAYGFLSVYPQADGGVRIYDRWKVDEDVLRRDDEKDRVGDLIAGGPIASLVYNAANKLGTYKPFDIDVTVPGEEWEKIQPIGPQPDFYTPDPSKTLSERYEDRMKDKQGSLLYFLNNLYNNYKAKQIN